MNRSKYPWRFRGLLAVGAVLFACLTIGVMAGCGKGSDGRVEIRFWNGFTGPDGREMLKIVREFNESQDEIYVTMQRIAWGTYYNKLFVAGIGGRAPEVFVIHNDVIPRFSEANFLRPVDQLLADDPELNVSDFDRNVWDYLEIDGTHFGIPLDVHMFGTYYNPTLLKQAGIVDAEGNATPPTDTASFLAATRKLTIDEDNDEHPEQWGYVFTWQRCIVYSMMCQNGGKFFTPDGERCIINNPENIEALQFCCDLINKEKVAPSPENFDAWVGFRQGNVGVAFEGVWMIGDLERQKDLDYAAAPFPKFYDKEQAVWAAAHNMCLRADLEGEELDAAWEFIKYLSDNSIAWAKAGQVPARVDVRASEAFQAMPVQSTYAAQVPIIRFSPPVKFIFEFYQEFDFAVDRALRGSVTPEEALAYAEERINAVMERRRQTLAEIEEAKQ